MNKTVAILTGGGDCPGLNAVIRAVVKTAINQYGWRVIGIEDGFDGLIGNQCRHELKVKDVRGLLARGGTILGTSNRGNPFSYPVIVNGKPEVKDMSAEVIKTFTSIGADALIAVGGDGTLRIALGLAQMGLNVVGIPKTIDNDLRATDITFVIGQRSALSPKLLIACIPRLKAITGQLLSKSWAAMPAG